MATLRNIFFITVRKLTCEEIFSLSGWKFKYDLLELRNMTRELERQYIQTSYTLSSSDGLTV